MTTTPLPAERQSEISHDEWLRISRAMRSDGGSFARALADCILVADDDNRDKIADAWPEMIKLYRWRGAR